MRKLATIQKITNIQPIAGADAIELAFVLGWQVVVKKGDFQVGDLAVYFEIDSWLDETNVAYETFRERFSNWTDPEGKPRHGMRLKTIKLRKQLSQGLLLKLATFPALLGALTEGDDVTNILGVEKWEPYEEVKGNNGGISKEAGAKQFPSFIRKTDQERVQNCINELAKHTDETFEVTIKLDGSSMTVYRVGNTSPHYAHVVEDLEKRMLKKMSFLSKLWWKTLRKLGLRNPPEVFNGVCSRNIQLDRSGNTHFAEFVRKHNLFDKIEGGLLASENYAFQGELIAPSIQNNYEKVKDFEFYIYDVFDIDKQTYLLPEDARVVTRCCGMNYVPVLSHAAVLAAGEPKEVVDGILAYAEGPGMNEGVKREGVVYKSNSTPFSFKAISNSYLLTKKD